VRDVLVSRGARIANTLEDLGNYRHSSRLVIVVPHTTRERDCPKFPGTEVVTEWWIEVCLYKDRFVEPSEDFTNSPFEEFPLEGISFNPFF
jgi:DNA replication regulator DPB11